MPPDTDYAAVIAPIGRRRQAVPLNQSFGRQPVAALHPRFCACTQPSEWQILCVDLLLGLLVAALLLTPSALSTLFYWFCWGIFMLAGLFRLSAALFAQPLSPHKPVADQRISAPLPVYSVIVALYREAALVPQLTHALNALIYPRHLMEVLIALEDDDEDTLIAFEDHFSRNPHLSYMKVVRVPAGFPRTKPRALNHALKRAHGDLVVIYDAEDVPHPQQLLEAATAFADGPSHLACLQAPLRPLAARDFMTRQFAVEYAAQFDVLLPAFRRLGLPFPLGGTSNHFKADVLKAVGAWDAYNVTEDADLGFRLAQYGQTIGLIACPTVEAPPSDIRTWLPQRSRWIKGYIQTLIVHTRDPGSLRLSVATVLFLSLGIGVLSAFCYAPFMMLLLTRLLFNSLQPGLPLLSALDMALFVFTLGSALGAMEIGARRAGLRLELKDRLLAPIYWSLQSLAAVFAVYQLIVRPFHWDKTDHKASESGEVAEAA